MTSELYKKLTRLQWLLHKRQMRCWAERGPMADTTRGQGRILAVLKLRDGISTKDLSYLLGVRISSLNELLQKMEKNGYITREPCDQDKRVMLVKLTDKGRGVQQPEHFDFDDIFSCLSEDEQKALGEYLDRIIDALQENTDEESMFDKMETLREKLGDMGAYIGDYGREFFGGRGFPHGSRSGFGPEHCGRGGYPGRHDFRGHFHDGDHGHSGGDDHSNNHDYDGGHEHGGDYRHDDGYRDDHGIDEEQ